MTLFSRILKHCLCLLLVFCCFLSCFSAGSSVNANATEITADTYISTASYQYYFYVTSDTTITEKYVGESSSYTGDSCDVQFVYNDCRGYLLFTFVFDFSDSKYVLGQTYNVEFDINTSQNYIYMYYFPHYMPIYFWTDFFQVGDKYLPWRLNSAFVNAISEDAKNELQSSTFDNVSHVSFPIDIPSDHKALLDFYGSTSEDVFSQSRVIILSYITLWSSKNQLLPSNIEISNIKLVPTGATELLYADKIYQNEILGSDEEGSESGIKGIFKKISELPLQIWSFIYDLGSRIGDFFTELKDNLLQGIKDLFVPTEEDITNFKDDMDKLLSEHLGVLYEAPTILSNLIQSLSEFRPYYSDSSDYFFDIDSLTLFIDSNSTVPLSLDDNGGYSFTVIPDNTGQGTYRVSFSFLNEQPYSRIYGIYNIFVTVVVLLAVLNYFLRKYEKMLGE